MNLKIFAVRDIATAQFGNPMFMVNSGQAIRSFADEVNREDKDSQLYKHPGDFELYELGDYDTETGLFKTCAPVQLVTGKAVRVQGGA